MPDLEPADAGGAGRGRARPDEGCCAAPPGSASRAWQRGHSRGGAAQDNPAGQDHPASQDHTASQDHAAGSRRRRGRSRGAAHDEPLVAEVQDARTGVVDLYTGTQHVRFTDHQLAARLARAAS